MTAIADSRDGTTPVRRVLFVSHHFPPAPAGGAVRSAQFVKFLPEFGWRPTVLTVRAGRDGEADLFEGAPVVRCRTLDPAAAVRGLSYGGRRTSRGPGRLAIAAARRALFPDRQVLWAPFALRAGRRPAAESDLVYATFGPASNLLVGARLARCSGRPLVLDFRDLWSGNPEGRPRLPLEFLHRRLERRTVIAAARVIMVSETMRERFAGLYPELEERLVVISNGFDPDGCELVSGVRPDHRFTLSHIGSLYGDRSLDPLLRVLGDLKSEGRISAADFRLRLVGNIAPGVLGPDLADLGEIRPYVPHDEALRLTASSHLLLVVEDDYVARYGVAAKVYDALMAGRELLVVTPGWSNSARLVAEIGAGRAVDPADAEGLKTALLDALERWREGRRWSYERPDLVRRFDRRHLTARLAETFDAALAGP